MSESVTIRLTDCPTVMRDSGVSDRELVDDGVRWSTAEYATGGRRAKWCGTPHCGFVISGMIRYEFEDGGDALTASAGDAFKVTSTPRHRGMNASDGPTRLFLIDGSVKQ